MAMRNGSAQMSSSIETIARSFTASERMVTPNIEIKPSTVDGMVRRFVVNVPKLTRRSACIRRFSADTRRTQVS